MRIEKPWKNIDTLCPAINPIISHRMSHGRSCDTFDYDIANLQAQLPKKYMGRQMNKSRVPELDLLRFLAAISVVIYHYGHSVDVGALSNIAEFGFLGVQIFFMISGFVILWTAMRKSALQFIVSRVSRLYPTFWACVGFTAITLYALDGHISPYRLLANLTMIPGQLGQARLDDVYWTLAIEIKFYGLILCLLLAKQLIHIRRWLAGWLILSLLAAVFPRQLHGFSLDQFSVYFIAGCYLYLIRTRFSLSDLVALAICAGLSVHNAVDIQEGFTRDSSMLASVLTGLIVLGEFAVFLAVALRRITLPALALWGWLGAMTFPLYLIHAGTVANIGKHYLSPGPLRFSLMLAVALVLALGLAAAIERKGCAALNRWLLGLIELIPLLPSRRRSRNSRA